MAGKGYRIVLCPAWDLIFRFTRGKFMHLCAKNNKKLIRQTCVTRRRLVMLMESCISNIELVLFSSRSHIPFEFTKDLHEEGNTYLSPLIRIKKDKEEFEFSNVL